MMLALLIIATLAAPILAIVVAEWMRRKRREKAQAEADTKRGMTGGVARDPIPGWVMKTIKDYEEGKER